MTETLSLRVDFNRADDNDIVWAYCDRASNPGAVVEGAALRLYDYEGNECLGYVIRVDEDVAYVRAEWSTWRDAEPIRSEELTGDDLAVALARAVAWHVYSPRRQETNAIVAS